MSALPLLPYLAGPLDESSVALFDELMVSAFRHQRLEADGVELSLVLVAAVQEQLGELGPVLLGSEVFALVSEEWGERLRPEASVLLEVLCGLNDDGVLVLGAPVLAQATRAGLNHGFPTRLL